MKKTDFSKWLEEFKMIVNSPTPRIVRNDLYGMSKRWPSRGELPELEIFRDILNTIVELRYSRCYGRADAEIWLMRVCLSDFLREIVFYDTPLDFRGEILPNPPAVEPALVELHTGIFKALADYSLTAIKNPPKREKKTHLRNEQAFELLGELSRRSELENEIVEGIEIAREIIRRKDDECAYHAIEFVDTCYIYWEQPIAADIFEEMKALEERSRREDTVFKINDLLIDLGETDELSALDRMESLRESQ